MRVVLSRSWLLLLLLLLSGPASGQPAQATVASGTREASVGPGGGPPKIPAAGVVSFFGIGPRRKWDDKIKVGPAISWRKGYRFTLGPRLNYRKYLGAENALRLSVAWLPLRFRDLGSDHQIDLTEFSASYIKHVNSRFFYAVGGDWSWFRPGNQLRDLVRARGGTIRNRQVTAGTLSIGQRVMKIPLSFRGRSFTLPVYLRVSYRNGEDYPFGTDLGDAGSDYGLRNGFSVMLWPMFSRF